MGPPRGDASKAVEPGWPALVYIEATASVRERLLAYFAAHGYERLERDLAHAPANWYFAPRAAPGAR
jgi:hypothetical protein